MHKFLFILMFVLPSLAKAEIAPDTLIRDTAQEVISLIKQEKASSNQNIKKLAETIDAKIFPHFNFSRMTKLAVGKDWKEANSEQQQALTKEFHTLLLRTYSSALEAYQNQTIEVLPLSLPRDASEATVKSRVLQPGKQPIPIDYRMEKAGSSWKIYDVSVDGVSLVTNYRSSFATEISNSGIDGLIKALAEKNKQNKK